MKQILKFLDRVKYFGLRKIYYLGKNIFVEFLNPFVDSGILKPELQQSLIKRKISRTLIDEYFGHWGHGTDKKQFFLGFGLIHYALVRNVKPARILCIGSKQGFIPAILALACKDNGGGHVDFVDAGYDETNRVNHWGGVGFWNNIDIRNHFGKIGVARHITSFIMTTAKFDKKYPKRKYDYVYLDGDHSYWGVKKDFKYFWPRLTKDGFMVLHDISERGRLSEGVYGTERFWKEMTTKNKISFPLNSGLGIIQKP
jgi:hypothetical protein